MYIAVYINVFTDLDMYTHESKYMLYQYIYTYTDIKVNQSVAN